MKKKDRNPLSFRSRKLKDRMKKRNLWFYIGLIAVLVAVIITVAFFSYIIIQDLNLSKLEPIKIKETFEAFGVNPANLITIVLTLVTWYTTLMLFAVGLSVYKNSKDFKDTTELHFQIYSDKIEKFNKDSFKKEMNKLIHSVKEFNATSPRLLIEYKQLEKLHSLKMYGKLCEIAGSQSNDQLMPLIIELQEMYEDYYRQMEHDLKVLMIHFGTHMEIESGLKYLSENGTPPDIRYIMQAVNQFADGNSKDEMNQLAEIAIRDISRRAKVKAG